MLMCTCCYALYLNWMCMIVDEQKGIQIEGEHTCTLAAVEVVLVAGLLGLGIGG